MIHFCLHLWNVTSLLLFTLIAVVIITMFRLLFPLAFFRCFSIFVTSREFQTEAFIQSTRVVQKEMMILSLENDSIVFISFLDYVFNK